jgi:AcrR family transcriptional regulator
VSAQRAPRSDGQRNRQRILEAARRAFATEGTEVTLNGIARDAGVGIATLFRHFPTREALIEASYSDSLEQLCATADDLLRANDSVDATRAWMGAFLDYMSIKQGMADTIRLLSADDLDSRVNTIDRMTAAIDVLLAQGRTDRSFRDDVPALDILAALGGIALMAGHPRQREQADRLVELLLAGLRNPSPEKRRRRPRQLTAKSG